MRKAAVSYPKKQATVTVVTAEYDEDALLQALTDAGFGGAVITPHPDRGRDPAAGVEERTVAFHFRGMKKTRSGAT